MHITKIELENIKSHADSTFEFGRGTTAITGNNGAGKTTIMESIAWALFDFLDYKKEDFVRRGAKKGSVRVTFESGLDEREYTVYRDTGTGYYVFDPRIKTRIAEKKEEVTRFLWQHLGVEAGTDLESLFRRAIGVPQGTYTAIFLETAAERKKAFERLLKVEDYRNGADELLKTSRYLQERIGESGNKIARAEGMLDRAEAIESDHKIALERVAELNAEIEKLSGEAETVGKAVAEMDAAASEVEKKRLERERAAASVERAVIQHAQAERDSEFARAAAEKLKDAEVGNARHIEAVSKISELERERTARDRKKDELAAVDASITNAQAEGRRLNDLLALVVDAKRTVEELVPKAAEQERMEAEMAKLREKAAAARTVAANIDLAEKRRERLRESYLANKEQLEIAEKKSGSAAELENLQLHDDEIKNELARLRASLERDEKFQSEIKNGLCPILSQKCLNLKEGETLSDFVSSQFSELRAEISVFEGRRTEVSEKLRVSLEAQKFVQAFEAYSKRAEEISIEGKQLNEELDRLRKQIEHLPAIEAELSLAEEKLAEAENPKARISLLKKEIAKEADLHAASQKIEIELERLRSERNRITDEFEKFKDIDKQLAECGRIRDETSAARNIYLANEAAAATIDGREREYETAAAELSRIKAELEAAEKAYAGAGRGYDRERHQSELRLLVDNQHRLTEAKTMFGAVKSRQAELAAELEQLIETRKAMRDELREKERLEKVAEATTFIRETLKEAAPRVARNYVHHVSLDANQTFREIGGNPERTLKWTEDYGIVLEENGHDRPFVSLSGGEQMAAALSVRLAILKQLSDIRIAFFDEPTTNMDAERRENLAQQIGGIKHFDQLFVISHDDTFEGYMDNEVRIEHNETN